MDIFLNFLHHPILFLKAIYIAHRIDCRFDGLWENGNAQYTDYQTRGSFVLTNLNYYSARNRRDHFRRIFIEGKK